MARGKEALVAQGYSERVAERICEPQAQSTKDIYQGKWKLFTQYCAEKGIDPWEVSVPQLGDFLTYLYDIKNMMPSTIDGYRTAIVGALKHVRGPAICKDPALMDLSAWMHSYKRVHLNPYRTRRGSRYNT